MKKTVKSTIYKLSEEDKNTIKKFYNLLKEIKNDMDVYNVIKVNDDDLFKFKYDEIKEMFNVLMGFLRADTLNITREESEVNKLPEYQVEVNINAIIETEAKSEIDANQKVAQLLFNKYYDYIKVLEVPYVTKK